MSDDFSPARFGTAFKAFMEAVVAQATPPASPLRDRILAHLGADPTTLPILSEQFESFDQPNIQVALDDYLTAEGRRAEIVGVSLQNKQFMSLGLSELLSRTPTMGTPPLTEGPVDYVNYHLDGERLLPCVQFGIYLISDGDARLLVAVIGPQQHHGPQSNPRVEVLAARTEDGQAFLAALLTTMQRLNVFRGRVISLGSSHFDPGLQSAVTFHTLPHVTRDDVILPPGLLERIERHTVVFSQHAERLRAAGRSLKRGLLLHGPPGVGKTLTVMYLIGQMPGRTVLLTMGSSMGLLAPVMQLARTLAPAMVVLEDVDLIAEARGPYHTLNPLLFQLLNEMDGLQDDHDVIFVLTTNRPDVLEPALAARPGRIDLVVEIPPPDAEGRHRLLALYARGISIRGLNLHALAARIAGATPVYIKELLRKAAVFAALEGGDGTAIAVTDAHLDAALAEVNEGGRAAGRILGFYPADEGPRGAWSGNETPPPP